MFQADAAWEEPKCPYVKIELPALVPFWLRLPSEPREAAEVVRQGLHLASWGSLVFPRTHLDPALLVSLQQHEAY